MHRINFKLKLFPVDGFDFFLDYIMSLKKGWVKTFLNNLVPRFPLFYRPLAGAFLNVN